MSDGKEYLQKAIEKAGSQAKLAAALGVSQQQVSYIMTRAKRIPAEVAVAIDRITDGEIPKSAMRPDIFGDAA